MPSRAGRSSSCGPATPRIPRTGSCIDLNPIRSPADLPPLSARIVRSDELSTRTCRAGRYPPICSVGKRSDIALPVTARSRRSLSRQRPECHWDGGLPLIQPLIPGFFPEADDRVLDHTDPIRLGDAMPSRPGSHRSVPPARTGARHTPNVMATHRRSGRTPRGSRCPRQRCSGIRRSIETTPITTMARDQLRCQECRATQPVRNVLRKNNMRPGKAFRPDLRVSKIRIISRATETECFSPASSRAERGSWVTEVCEARPFEQRVAICIPVIDG